MMLKDIFFALWFFLPAATANVVPIFAAKIPGLGKFDTPIDGGLKFRGKHLLGAHKTWRGLVCGIIFATIVFWLQQLLIRHLGWLQNFTSQVDYSALPTLLVGPLFGIGALGGDAIKSFFKRQFNVKPGHSWFPFDQLDYIIGGAIAVLPFIRLTVMQYIWLLLVWLLVHLVSCYIGWLMGFKDSPI